jgi:hypothetical protein
VARTAVEEIKRNPAVLNDWLERRELEPLLEVLLEPRVRRGWRITVLNWLPDVGDSRVVPALIQALADDDFAIRAARLPPSPTALTRASRFAEQKRRCSHARKIERSTSGARRYTRFP